MYHYSRERKHKYFHVELVVSLYVNGRVLVKQSQVPDLGNGSSLFDCMLAPFLEVKLLFVLFSLIISTSKALSIIFPSRN